MLLERYKSRIHAKNHFKRLAEVEARLALQGRDELGLGGDVRNQKVDGKEATQRLGAVNTQLGQIIDRSQATNERLVDSSQVLRSTHGEQERLS